VTATGRSKASAVRALKAVVADRSGPAGGLMTADMRLTDVAELWLALIAAEGYIEKTTLSEYRRVLENVVTPGHRQRELREATAGRMQRLILSQPIQSRSKKVKVILGMMLDGRGSRRRDLLEPGSVHVTTSTYPE
jgi:hypothetical protein